LIRQLLQTMFPNFIGYFLISQVGVRAYASAPELSRPPSRRNPTGWR
jgi:hypothetical protein